MIRGTTIILFLVTLVMNSFFLGMGGSVTILKLKKLCTCEHSTYLHVQEDHSNDPSKPHFCPRHKTNQKVENHFVVYPLNVVTTTIQIYLTYNVLFLVKPYSYPLLDSWPSELLRPPETLV